MFESGLDFYKQHLKEQAKSTTWVNKHVTNLNYISKTVLVVATNGTRFTFYVEPVQAARQRVAELPGKRAESARVLRMQIGAAALGASPKSAVWESGTLTEPTGTLKTAEKMVELISGFILRF